MPSLTAIPGRPTLIQIIKIKENVISYLIEVLHDVFDDVTARVQVGTNSYHTKLFNAFLLNF